MPADPKGPERKPEGEGEELSNMARQMRAAQPYIGMVWKLVGGAAVGVMGGMFVDKQFGTTPWGVVGLSTVGITVGFYAFIRAALRMGNQGKK